MTEKYISLNKWLEQLFFKVNGYCCSILHNTHRILRFFFFYFFDWSMVYQTSVGVGVELLLSEFMPQLVGLCYRQWSTILVYKNGCGIADLVIDLIMKVIIYSGDKPLVLEYHLNILICAINFFIISITRSFIMLNTMMKNENTSFANILIPFLRS